MKKNWGSLVYVFPILSVLLVNKVFADCQHLDGTYISGKDCLSRYELRFEQPSCNEIHFSIGLNGDFASDKLIANGASERHDYNDGTGSYSLKTVTLDTKGLTITYEYHDMRNMGPSVAHWSKESNGNLTFVSDYKCTLLKQ